MNDREDNLSVEIKKETSDKGVPYIELLISYPYDSIDITFRAYPKNVFVAVENNSENPFSGADLDDCWIAPSVIVLKVSKQEFSPRDAFVKAVKQAFTDPDWMIDDLYAEVEGKIGEWMATWR